MSERKINLEEILKSYLTVETMKANKPDYTFNMVLSAMKEACRQVLELASENAQLIGEALHNNRLPKDYVCGITQFNDQTDDFYYEVDKESITNTINQVKL